MKVYAPLFVLKPASKDCFSAAAVYNFSVMSKKRKINENRRCRRLPSDTALRGILYLWAFSTTPLRSTSVGNARSASMVSSFMIFGFVLGNLIGGFLQDKTNPRLISLRRMLYVLSGHFSNRPSRKKTVALIYLTYSGLGGLGCGFAYGCVLSCLQKWFPDNRGFASGLSVSAFGLSTVLFGPVAQTLLNRLGVPHTFMTLAGVFLWRQ